MTLERDSRSQRYGYESQQPRAEALEEDDWEQWRQIPRYSEMTTLEQEELAIRCQQREAAGFEITQVTTETGEVILYSRFTGAESA